MCSSTQNTMPAPQRQVSVGSTLQPQQAIVSTPNQGQKIVFVKSAIKPNIVVMNPPGITQVKTIPTPWHTLRKRIRSFSFLLNSKMTFFRTLFLHLSAKSQRHFAKKVQKMPKRKAPNSFSESVRRIFILSVK